MTKLHIVDGAMAGQSFDLRNDTILIGRAADNDVQIKDAAVSRKHLKFTRHEGRFFIEDLGSQNGTWIKGQLIRPKEAVEVKVGNSIVIGDVLVNLGRKPLEDYLATQYSIDFSDLMGEKGENLLYKSTLTTNRKRLEKIHEVSTVLSQSLDIGEICEKIMDSLLYCLKEMDSGIVLLIDNNTGDLEERISRSRDSNNDIKVSYSRTIVDRVISEGKALMISDTRQEDQEELSDSIEMMRLRSIMCTPLMSKSGIRGVIYVHSTSALPGFPKDNLFLLAGLSIPTAVALEKASLYTERKQAEEALKKAHEALEKRVEERTAELIKANKKLEAEITDRKQMEDALRDSEERYRNLVENSLSVIILYRQNDIIYANEQFFNIFGYKGEELQNLVIDDILAPEVIDAVAELRRRRLAGEIEQATIYETKGKRKGGEIFDMEISVCVVSYQGERCFMAFLSDISKRKQAEMTLLKNKQQYERLIQGSIQGISIQQENVIQFVNRATVNIFGYDNADELVGKDFYETLVEPEEWSELKNRISTLPSGKSLPVHPGWHGIRKDGTRIWVQSSANLILWKEQPAVLNFFVDVTELKQAEEELEKLVSVVKYSSELVNLATLEGRMIFLNEAGGKMLGISPDEVKRINIMEVIPEHLTEFVQNELLPALMEGGTWEGELQYRNIKTGDLTDVHAMTFTVKKSDTGEPLFLANVSRDITERKRADEALQREKESFQILVEESPLGVALIDKDGLYKYINPKFVKIFNYTLEDIPTGKEWFLKAYPEKDYREQVISTWIDDKKKFSIGESRPRTFTVRCEDGSEKVIHFKPVTMGTGDELVIYEDKTETEQLESQLRQAQKMEAIGTLAGGIAHDFNNILAIIVGNTELAIDDVPDWNPAKESLKEIRSASIRAKDLVRQILSLSLKSSTEKKPIQISPIMVDSLKLLRASFPSDVEIRQNISCEHDTILAESTHLNQVLMNLCTNAAHAMREEGGVLEVDLQNVEFGKQNRELDLEVGLYVKLSVRDTGHGIDPKVIDRIFDPYFTTKALGVGTGMGLAVVHGIVKSYDGAITVKSEVGKGSVFEVLIPWIEAEVLEELEEEEELPTGDECILFVDDEEGLVEAYTSELNRLGYDVVSFTNPLEALEAFQKKPEKFDLVITDMTMPRLRGDKLAKKMMEIRPDTPVILSTGYSEHISDDEAEEMGIKAYVMKPLVKRDLAKTVRSVLDNK